jgi:hypothetical protein
MKHDCDKEREIDLIHEDLKEIKADVKAVLSFKWQIMGGAGIIGALAGLAASITGLLK